MNELVIPELELRVFDELNKRDKQTPWMRPVHNQALQKNSEVEKEKKRFLGCASEWSMGEGQISYLVICS